MKNADYGWLESSAKVKVEDMIAKIHEVHDLATSTVEKAVGRYETATNDLLSRKWTSDQCYMFASMLGLMREDLAAIIQHKDMAEAFAKAECIAETDQNKALAQVVLSKTLVSIEAIVKAEWRNISSQVDDMNALCRQFNALARANHDEVDA